MGRDTWVKFHSHYKKSGKLKKDEKSSPNDEALEGVACKRSIYAVKTVYDDFFMMIKNKMRKN